MGRLFHRLGAEFLNDRSENFNLDVRGGTVRRRVSEERVWRLDWIVISCRKYDGCELWSRLWVMEMILYWIRCSTFSQCREKRDCEM